MIDRNTISLIANIARSSAADAMYKQAQQPYQGPGPQNVDPGDDNYDVRGMLDSARHDPTNTGEDVGYGGGYDPYQYGVPSVRSHELGRDRSGLPPSPRPKPPRPSTNPFIRERFGPGGFSPFGPRGGYPDDSPFKLPKPERSQRSPLPFPAYGGGPDGNPLRGMPALGGALGGGLGGGLGWWRSRGGGGLGEPTHGSDGIPFDRAEFAPRPTVGPDGEPPLGSEDRPR